MKYKDKQYYLDNITSTFNGFVYKDYDAFKSGKGVCYICEMDLEALESGEATLEEVAETRETILKKCSEFEHPGKTLEEFATMVFEDSDWTCIETTIDQMLDYWEEWSEC